jgi:N-acetylneuraminic acid mutarotase
VQKYSISKDNWTTVAPIPIALNHPNAAVVNDKIYVLGGLASAGGIWSASNMSAVYDPVTNKWTTLPPFPAGRAVGAAAVGVDGTTIYLAGGLLNTILSNDTEETTTMVTSFDTVSNIWAKLPNMPAPRDHAGAGLVDRKLYVLGGRAFGHWNVVNTVFSFDLRTKIWMTGLAPMPTARGGCASATIGTKIYTAGGEGNVNDPLNIFHDMQAYDTATNKWTILKNMTTALHGTSAASLNDRVYIPGGGTALGGFPTNLFEVFDT